MTNDGHDTNVTFGSQWLRGFVENLMNNTYFWDNTLLLLTFDETETYDVPSADVYDQRNRVFSILMGGAVPEELVGTKDSTVYTHYSTLASVQANWGLPSLGRWDCGANLFQIVADKVNYTNWDVNANVLWLNESLPGPLEDWGYSKYRSNWPVPTTNDTCSSGNGILQSVVDTYKGQAPTYNYSSPFPYDTAYGLDVGVQYSRNGELYISGVNTTGTVGYDYNTNQTSPSSAATTTAVFGAASGPIIPALGSLGLLLGALLAL